MKTSQRGMLRSVTGSRRSCGIPPRPALLGIGERRLAHPRALVMGLAARLHALVVAGAVPGDDLPELLEIDCAERPMPARFVEAQLGVGEGQPEIQALRHGGVDELLAQLVVRE